MNSLLLQTRHGCPFAPFIFKQLIFPPLKMGFLVPWHLIRSNSIFLTSTRDAKMQPEGLPVLRLGCLSSRCQQQSVPAASKADGELSPLISRAWTTYRMNCLRTHSAVSRWQVSQNKFPSPLLLLLSLPFTWHPISPVLLCSSTYIIWWYGLAS